MTALVVIMILVLGMFAAGVRTLEAGKHEPKTGAARMAAEAGIEYAYCQYVYNSGTPPPYASILPRTYNHNFCCGPGGFNVTITDNTAVIIGTVLVVSTGTVNGDSVTITRTIAKPKTCFDYALVCSIPITNTYFPIITGAGGKNGDIRADGNFGGYSFSLAAGSQINGDAVGQAAISIPTVTGSQITNAAWLPVPEVNTTYYAGIANRVFVGPQTWSGFTFQSPYEVVFVYGDVTINSGLFSGTGTIVNQGKTHLNGNTDYAASTSKIAILNASGFDTNGNYTIVGFYLTHNYFSNGTSQNSYGNGNAPWNLTLKSGSLAADNYYIGNWPTTTWSFTHDPEMNDQLGKNLHLPGY